MSAAPPPAASSRQILNMSLGFVGIQFGWGLQMANMSSIYEYLGADAHQIPLLWLAAPLTGLIVQPLIGYLSDHTWNRLGRRRPYFLTGALLAALSLLAMPSAPTLLAAAGLLWVLDASINICMEPFRAFVADLLPAAQRTRGFAMQALLIGIGAVIASSFPWFLQAVLHIEGAAAGPRAIPLSVRLSFYVGAGVFLGTVLYTIATTSEQPPADLAALRRLQAQRGGLRRAVAAIWADLFAMPAAMRQLAVVQLFTWLGLFCMWLYLGVAVARNIFHGTPGTPAYEEGIAWGGNCFAAYSAVCFGFAFALPRLSARLGRRLTHAACLTAGAIGLLSVPLLHSKYALLLSMVGVGIAWASILAIPYSLVSEALPPGKVGVYMGIFNFFIVIPEICAALLFGPVMEKVLTADSRLVRALGGDNRLTAVALGGLCLAIAAALVLRVREAPPPKRLGAGAAA